ncbi:MAG TPA: sulfite exporter TauE/SafE family protein [Oscillatoriaceae cyanobacterium]
MIWFLLILAGMAAGLISTIAGLGGGILLVAGLSPFLPPALVIGTTAPALLIGNASRAWFLREGIDWGLVARFSLLAVPCALGASLLAPHLPAALLRRAIAALVLVFFVRMLKPKEKPAPARNGGTVFFAGALAGSVSGLTGGAGFLALPILARFPLSPVQLVATETTCMALIHLTKSVCFGAVGSAPWPMSAALALGVVLGNALGRRVLATLPRELFRRLLLGAMGLAGLMLAIA